MSQEEIAESTEGLTMPAEAKPDKDAIAHEKMRMQERKDILGPERFKAEQDDKTGETARMESVMSGADLTEDQEKALKEANKGGDAPASDSITGSSRASDDAPASAQSSASASDASTPTA